MEELPNELRKVFNHHTQRVSGSGSNHGACGRLLVHRSREHTFINKSDGSAPGWGSDVHGDYTLALSANGDVFVCRRCIRGEIVTAGGR